MHVCIVGTSDRVLLLSGSLHSVLTAIFMILEKVSRDALLVKSKPTVHDSKQRSEHDDEVCGCG